MKPMFLSCDWGTSSFRLRLINDQLDCIGLSFSGQGIASVYKEWLAQTGIDRIIFYQRIIQQHIQHIENELNFPLNGIPVIVSGMVSSTIGIIELPYKKLPFAVKDASLITEIKDATENFNHPLVLVSGIATGNDVARGEETALLGAFGQSAGDKQVYIFPGTHSKHIVVENGLATGFKTYMTGEVFQLLSEKSILSNSVSSNRNFDNLLNKNAFKEGVRTGYTKSILHAAFMVRTNQLFTKNSPEENFWYLSGLVIGEELKDLQHEETGTINLVSDGLLMDLYEFAITIRGAASKLYKINLEQAIMNGHSKMHRQHLHP